MTLKPSIPNELVDILESLLGKEYWKKPKLQKDVLNMSDQFTSDRKNLDLKYLDHKRGLDAYLAYFLPMGFLKIEFLLQSGGEFSRFIESQKSTQLQSTPVTFMDFGSGPGTASLAFLYLAYQYKISKKIKITLIDIQPKSIEFAKKIILEFAKILELDVEVDSFSQIDNLPAGSRFNFIVAANVLNEFQTQDSEKDIGISLYEFLEDKPEGKLLFLEPSHRVSSQKLIRFRERAIKHTSGKVRIIGPCLHSDTCPLLRSSHWCHFSERVSCSFLNRLNISFFNNPRHWIKFSYLYLSNNTLGSPTKSANRFRAIGDLHLISNPNKACAIDLCQPKVKKMLTLDRNYFFEMKNILLRGVSLELDKSGKPIKICSLQGDALSV